MLSIVIAGMPFGWWQRVPEESSMGIRPRVKKAKKSKFRRCPKCHKVIRIKTRRCRTCHLVQIK
jgi:hypothetical protein